MSPRPAGGIRTRGRDDEVAIYLDRSPVRGRFLVVHDPADSVTLTLPRSAIADVVTLSDSLLERMHELLERNTDGGLSPVEREEVETLVVMAQFGQLVSMALRRPEHP